jgi:hypothetical protein
MFQTKVVETPETNFIFKKMFFENCDLREMMWKNMVELEKPQMTTWRIRVHAGYIRLQIRTLRLCSYYLCSTSTMSALTSLSVTFYLYCLPYLNSV